MSPARSNQCEYFAINWWKIFDREGTKWIAVCLAPTRERKNLFGDRFPKDGHDLHGKLPFNLAPTALSAANLALDGIDAKPEKLQGFLVEMYRMLNIDCPDAQGQFSHLRIQLANAERQYGHTSKELIIPLMQLGLMHCIEDEFSLSEALLQRALRIRRLQIDSTLPDSPEIAMALLRWVYIPQGLFAQAQRLTEEFLKATGNFSYAASAYSDVSAVAYKLEKPIMALETYKRAIALMEMAPDTNASYLAAAYHNVAGFYGLCKQWFWAAHYYERALLMKLALNGEGNMDAAEAYRHLAQAYNKISRSADAELLARRAIDICAAVIDDSSSPLPEFMMTLAISYRQQGKVSAAESVLLSILDLEESTGENKNVLVRTLTAYAELLICAGRKVEADAVLLKAKHIR